MRKGIYFSASDAVYNWTLAFLKSFRAHNPKLTLYLIPFNEDTSKIRALQRTYNFEIFLDPSFSELEALGEAYELGHSAYGKYWFRRYASFWGPLDVFMYLDCRQLILGDLSPVLDTMAKDNLDFMYYDLAINQVYELGELRQDLLVQKVARGFNSGRWAARKGLFSKDDLLKFGYESLNFRAQLNPRNTDQAFINYCLDQKPELKTVHIAEYLGGYIQQGWAGQRGKLYKGEDAFYWWDYGGLQHKKKVLLLHWAGFGWDDALPQVKWLNLYSQPTFRTRVKRKLNGMKRNIKGSFTFRKLLGHV